MYQSSAAFAALLSIQLNLPISAPAQSGPTAIEIATGDVWSSREELVYVPREALELPSSVEPGDLEWATGDVLPTSKRRPPLPQQALVPKVESNKILDQVSH
jgi:hypothetical protein